MIYQQNKYTLSITTYKEAGSNKPIKNLRKRFVVEKTFDTINKQKQVDTINKLCIKRDLKS